MLHGRGKWVTVLILYGVITLAVTFPWVLHFNTHTPDGGGEGSVGLWNIWHFHHRLGQGSPLETNLLTPPYTQQLIFHTYTLSRNLLALPLLPIFGLVVTNNLLTLLSFSLSGLAMCLLVHDLTGDIGASFVAGLIYAFAPYRFAHLSSHYQLITIEWMPFYTLFALRYLRQGTWPHLSLAVVFALLNSLTDYYYALYLVVWSGMFVVAQLLSTADRRQPLKRASLLAGVAVVTHLPLLTLMHGALTQGAWVGRPPGQAMLKTFSADLAAFITPSAQHPLLGAWADQISAVFTANFAERTVYLGLLPLVLALVATAQFQKWPAARRWWILAFWGFGLLALGPVLHWRGLELFPLPAQWFGEIPILREARIPSRWTIMVMLTLAVLAGQTLARLGQHWGQRQRYLMLALGAGLVLFEYLPAPLRLADRSVPLVYHTIAQTAPAGAVLDLPFGINDSFQGLGGWNPKALYFQTITARPIIGAHISRIPASIFAAYTQLPIIGRLASLEQGATFSAADVSVDQPFRDQIAETLDLRFIVVPDWYQKMPGHLYLQQVFAGCLEPLPSDARATGYRVRRPCPALTSVAPPKRKLAIHVYSRP